ncbi:hypothetical protein [Streptomyces sp. NPDC001401]|uniref:hypothetical protein n=1 Tax=Streptomyces sp. NPDC001401 TaxID=3364570 RepID=UPI00369360C5
MASEVSSLGACPDTWRNWAEETTGKAIMSDENAVPNARGGPALLTCSMCWSLTRIAHGIRAIEDRALLEQLADPRTTLDVCLTSNRELGVVKHINEHPLPRILEAGVSCSWLATAPSDPVIHCSWAPACSTNIASHVHTWRWWMRDWPHWPARRSSRRGTGPRPHAGLARHRFLAQRRQFDLKARPTRAHRARPRPARSVCA